MCAFLGGIAGGEGVARRRAGNAVGRSECVHVL